MRSAICTSGVLGELGLPGRGSRRLEPVGEIVTARLAQTACQFPAFQLGGEFGVAALAQRGG
jgi:hypothetical protein